MKCCPPTGSSTLKKKLMKPAGTFLPYNLSSVVVVVVVVIDGGWSVPPFVYLPLS